MLGVKCSVSDVIAEGCVTTDGKKMHQKGGKQREGSEAERLEGGRRCRDEGGMLVFSIHGQAAPSA